MTACRKYRYIRYIVQQAEYILYRRHFVLSCVIGALLLRIVWIFVIDAIPASDANWYYSSGINIAAGRGYIMNDVPTAYWPVGYPAFLGIIFYITGPSILAAQLMNVLLNVGAIYLVYQVSLLLHKQEYAARIALLAMAVYPNHIAWCANLWSEMLGLFCVVLGVYFVLKQKNKFFYAICAGTVFGIAALTKTQLVFMPIVIIFLPYRNMKERFTVTSVVGISLILTLMPWMIRNHHSIGSLRLSTNGGNTILAANNPYTPGDFHWNENIARISCWHIDDNNIVKMNSEIDIDDNARKAAIDYIIAYPDRYLNAVLRRIVIYLGSDHDGLTWNVAKHGNIRKPQALLYHYCGKMMDLYWYIILMLYAVMIIQYRKISKLNIKVPIYPLVMVVCFTAFHAMVVAFPRYHIILAPWIVIYSSIAVQVLVQNRSKISL